MYERMLKSVLTGDWLFDPAQMRERLKEYRVEGAPDARFDEALQKEYFQAVGTDDGPDGFILWFDTTKQLWMAAARDVLVGLWGHEAQRAQSEKTEAAGEGTPEWHALIRESITRKMTFHLITTVLLKNDEWRKSLPPDLLDKMRRQVAYIKEAKPTDPFSLPVPIGPEVACYAVLSPDDQLSIEEVNLKFEAEVRVMFALEKERAVWVKRLKRARREQNMVTVMWRPQMLEMRDAWERGVPYETTEDPLEAKEEGMDKYSVTGTILTIVNSSSTPLTRDEIFSNAKEAQPPLREDELEAAWKVLTEGTEHVGKLISQLEPDSNGLVTYARARGL
jgi:hypothetical protein